ncbi:MAG TPA: amino acid ABC transporter permease [Anaerolineales bacterium]|nr:amino acid ABC transporter permease [Anaerolineales bacterium]
MATAARLGGSGHESPPTRSVGVVEWIRQNLFSTWFNGLLTILSLAVTYLLLRATIVWALQANWLVLTKNSGVILWGRYPRDETWRIGISLILLIGLSAVTLAAWRSDRYQRFRSGALIGWLASPLVITLLLRGFFLPTPATIGNNLGYYLFRPDLLLRLGQEWRASAALLIVGAMAGITWGVSPDRLRRSLAVAASLISLILVVPLGLHSTDAVPGLSLPRLLPMLLLLGVVALAGWRAGLSVTNFPGITRLLVIGWIITLPLIILILTAFEVGIPRFDPATVLTIVNPAIWSGILLTLILSVVSILASFPIGVLLALGRRSGLTIVRLTSILFIEVVRGVPLITILFMSQVMFPLFFPVQLTIDRVLRAMVGMTLFTAAYLAEVVRGGLQAVQKEQVEAARALGLSELLVTSLIVLPQALRVVIPPIMGQFVSIFKDTSLVAIVGLLDLLGVLQSIIKQREFIGAVREVYLFAFLFYFVLSYAMSYASRRLEKRLGVGER